MTLQEKNRPLTDNMARAIVSLGHLLREESERKVWEVIKVHYEQNHSVRVQRICNFCDGRAIVQGDKDEEKECPSCYGRGTW